MDSHELDQKAACFGWFQWLDNESGWYVVQRRRKAWETHRNKGVNDKQPQFRLCCTSTRCIGSKHITEISKSWHGRCHCVCMANFESKTCWSFLSRIDVDAGLKHTGGILSQYVDVSSQQCMSWQDNRSAGSIAVHSVHFPTGCAIMKGRPNSPKVTLSCCSAYHYASLCISARVWYLCCTQLYTCCCTCILGLLSWAWTSPIEYLFIFIFGLKQCCSS